MPDKRARRSRDPGSYSKGGQIFGPATGEQPLARLHRARMPQALPGLLESGPEQVFVDLIFPLACGLR